MINGERVKQAREIKGLTQTELAERVGVTQSAIGHLERNGSQLLFQPSDELVEAIAFQTGFPRQFFRQESAPEFPLGSLLYRKKSTLKSQDKHRLHQLARLLYEIAEKMSKRVTNIQLKLPRVINESPVIAARLARAELGLSPDTPVKNLLNQLEKNGVLVLALPYTIDEHESFSLWADSLPRRPVVVISDGKPGDRQRFTLAHELGHLIMHYSFPEGLKKIEDEADQFASEFLLPEDAMRREITAPVTLTSLAELKPRWGVSIAALTMRAKELEIITERQSRYLFMQKRAKGWDKQEPENLNIKAEKPRAFKRMAEVLHGMPINIQKVAAYNSSPTHLIKEIMTAYADKPDMPAKTETNNKSKVVSIHSRR